MKLRFALTVVTASSIALISPNSAQACAWFLKPTLVATQSQKLQALGFKQIDGAPYFRRGGILIHVKPDGVFEFYFSATHAFHGGNQFVAIAGSTQSNDDPLRVYESIEGTSRFREETISVNSHSSLIGEASSPFLRELIATPHVQQLRLSHFKPVTGAKSLFASNPFIAHLIGGKIVGLFRPLQASFSNWIDASAEIMKFRLKASPSHEGISSIIVRSRGHEFEIDDSLPGGSRAYPALMADEKLKQASRLEKISLLRSVFGRFDSEPVFLVQPTGLDFTTAEYYLTTLTQQGGKDAILLTRETEADSELVSLLGEITWIPLPVVNPTEAPRYQLQMKNPVDLGGHPVPGPIEIHFGQSGIRLASINPAKLHKDSSRSEITRFAEYLALEYEAAPLFLNFHGKTVTETVRAKLVRSSVTAAWQLGLTVRAPRFGARAIHLVGRVAAVEIRDDFWEVTLTLAHAEELQKHLKDPDLKVTFRINPPRN